MVDNNMRHAQDWELQNPEMEAMPVPAGYNAKYLYQLSAVRGNEEISADFEDMGGWGIISLETDHRLSPKEMEEYQSGFESEGIICICDMRLIKQTFTYKK